MSEFLGNDPMKQEKLKHIIKRLHDGEPVEDVRHDFSRLIRNVSPEEIASMEQELIGEGLPVSEVQRLCDVHVEVFQSAMTREKGKGGRIPGHPVHTYLLENKTAKKLLKGLRKTAKICAGEAAKEASKGRTGSAFLEKAAVFDEEFTRFSEIEKHYARKENQLFPYLEKTGFTGPSNVMWGKHDEIRDRMKEIRKLRGEGDWKKVSGEAAKLAGMVKNMAFMEERILFPNAVKRLSDADWADIRRGEPEIGYAWVTPGNLWDANIASRGLPGAGAPSESAGAESGSIPLDTGALPPDMVNLLLKNLPVDITVVDENDKVLYYSAGLHRVFPRSPGIIGRDVQNCHPPKSVHVVTRIVDSFKKKEKDVAEFWLQMNGRFIHIRYFPLYDDSGQYRGVIEVSQDVTEIRGLKDERRLLDRDQSEQAGQTE